jgi:nucleotide-binding universal stress UspA family protein
MTITKVVNLMNEAIGQARNVLVAIDDSAAAAPVLATAKMLAKLFDASLKAVHVNEGQLRAARQTAQQLSVPFSAANGPVIETLSRLASQADVVAVSVGARRTPGGRRPVGGTALGLITAVEKPVAVVPPDATVAPAISRMLLAADSRMPNAPALPSVLSNAIDSGVDVTVVHVFEESAVPMFDDQPQHDLDEWEREFIARLGLSPSVAVSFGVGRPGTELVEESRRSQSHLLILAWHQDLSVGHAGVVRQVLEDSTVPVLLLPVIQHGGTTPAPEPTGTDRASAINAP